MSSIRTKFLVAVGTFAVLFFGFGLLRTWLSIRKHTEDLTASQAELALQFDLAIRRYVGGTIRPLMEEQVGRDEFIPEAMSTSFVARSVFEEVRKELPDYIIRFSSDNPRNPANSAGPEEMGLIQHFRDNPAATKWSGPLQIDGKEYLVHSIPRRMDESCLRCHGRPEDAPASLISRYGSRAGFHRSVGEVVALDMVGIPLDKIHAATASEAKAQLILLGIGVVILAGAFVLLFRFLVGNRLAAITKHFRKTAIRPDETQLDPISVSGHDEIAVLAASFNSLVARLQTLHSSLEQRVDERTTMLQTEINERRRVEEALRLAQFCIDHAADAVFWLDPHGRVVYANDKACCALGYSSEELRSMTVHDFDPMFPKEVWPAHWEELRQKKSFVIESCHRTKSGDLIPLEIAVNHIEFAGNEYNCAFARDITERKRTETTLAQFAAIVNSCQDAIIGRNLDGTITSWNAGAERLYGYSAEEAIGRPISILALPDGQNEITSLLNVIRRVGTIDQFETCLRRKDGTRVDVSIALSPINDAQGQVSGVSSISRDITDRKQAEQELTEAKQAAESASRAKSEFLANMSHEIRTPLTAILGYADVLLGSAKDPEAIDSVQIIKRNGEHLLNVINDILDLSKIEAGKHAMQVSVASPRQVADEVMSMMKVRADAKCVPLTLEVQGAVPEKITTDPIRLRQILVNLVGNAVKFTEEGSVRVVMQLDKESAEEARLRFDVIDTGIGMSQDEISRLFHPFCQADTSTSRRFGGTGLGLAISRRLVGMLGGDIEVKSVVGRGSTFSLTIPAGLPREASLVEQTAEAAKGDEQPTQSTASYSMDLRCRVLLAEDGLDNQRLIAFFLRKAGAEVTVAENGQEAVAMALVARSRATPFDVVLMDMHMPVMDGYEATRQLRAAGCSDPIVALTAHAMEDDRQKCLDAGCDGYVTKPIDRTLLLETVARYVNGQPISREVSAGQQPVRG